MSSKSFLRPVGPLGILLLRYWITFVCLFFIISSWAFCWAFSNYFSFYYFVIYGTFGGNFGGSGRPTFYMMFDEDCFGGDGIYSFGEIIIYDFTALRYYYFFCLSYTTLYVLSL